MKIHTGLYLIPNVAAFHPLEPGLLPDAPPLIAIEVLSPDDRLSEVRAKLHEYTTWGVPHVLLVDPHSRRMYTSEAGLHEVLSLPVPELGLELMPSDLFE